MSSFTDIELINTRGIQRINIPRVFFLLAVVARSEEHAEGEI